MAEKVIKCPYCGKPATGEHRMRRHLKGARKRGGHELSEQEAEGVLADIRFGRKPPPLPPLPEMDF